MTKENRSRSGTSEQPKPSIPAANIAQGISGGSREATKVANWTQADESLDEALQETFPASDALSIIQTPLKARYL